MILKVRLLPAIFAPWPNMAYLQSFQDRKFLFVGKQPSRKSPRNLTKPMDVAMLKIHFSACDWVPYHL